MVTVTPVAQQGRPDNKVYAVCDAGRAELARWIAEPLSGRGSSVADNRTRDIAVKVRGCEYGDPDAVRAQVAALRAERAELLDTYRGFEKRQFPDPNGLSGAALHQYLVLRGGIRVGDDFIICCRMSMADSVEDGQSWDEITALATEVEAAGATLINTRHRLA